MAPLDSGYELLDRYDREKGRVYITGTQALVRILLMQSAMDKRDNVKSAGFVSGYRGSPLGAVDQELWRAKKHLKAADVEFLPAINEDLAATAVLGSQQVETDPDKTVDGVYAMWYGKGPGVDRAGDALKHGNAYGSSENGGVLVVAGDDHGCVSSSMAHQSDVAFMDWFMPTLNPASISEYIEFGLYGYALSRFSGMWVGFKAISETVEGAASIEIGALPTFITPPDYDVPEMGLHYRWPDLPGPQIENRMVVKKEAVLAFVRANPIDRCIYNNSKARFGIVTTGKGHLDLMEALRLLGLTEEKCRDVGIDIYKVGMTWPLEMNGLTAFMEGKDEILVVEEKRGIIESEIKEYCFSNKTAPQPRVHGKEDGHGQSLLPWVGELSPKMVAKAVAHRVKETLKLDLVEVAESLETLQTRENPVTNVSRLPYFCSGCPHNRSTKVPEGSKALAGIGCHFMASWMDRDTESLIQMGGEGINWVGRSKFTGNGHIFQNLGEGTYFHSGYMAIRQAKAAETNITYKILFNDAVAMTGGQPVDGPISVPQIAHQVRAEGVEPITILSDEPERYNSVTLPDGVRVLYRDELDRLQREYREIEGVSVIIYDQTCAAEKRRRRKRGTYPDPAKRAFINSSVCEGCGDCSVQSNCLSIVPKETMNGRKRQIDQHNCNKDFSCVDGFCPSFVTVEGGALRKPTAAKIDDFDISVANLPLPTLPAIDGSYDLLVGGVGGTGVVTIGAIMTMAGHLEGKGASVLDFMGFAQKGGTVLSFVRFSSSPDSLNQVRIETGQADAMIACDMVVATGPAAMKVLGTGSTRITLNDEEIPTGDYVMNRDADMDVSLRTITLANAVGKENLNVIHATHLAKQLMGDSVFSNMLMAGYAWQLGLVPLSYDAIMRAVELNGVAVSKNKAAFNWGRLAAENPDYVNGHARPVEKMDRSFEALKDHHQAFLAAYQNDAYATLYSETLKPLMQAEKSISDEKLVSEVAAKALFKAMAIKDEYEVARLYTDGSFEKDLRNTFEGNFSVKYHMAPPIFGWAKDASGRPKKRKFGGWMKATLSVIRRFKFLRNTPLDVFGYSHERRLQRQCLQDVTEIMGLVAEKLNENNQSEAILLLESYLDVRGYGPVFETALKDFEQKKPMLLEAFIAASYEQKKAA
ncbi:indolepyruvate ferredoxin oxidoreductase family protein [Temperatibacter marinus]|uniref:Indolepyruvate ferredoxin oxidoreductase family protein n=1 Tax=Temperatibacter marinus TaxID=1456591 RepID=A0AA52EEQ5_9PROT|nr:indolepyruvate ferredoxin oxidoreductase family protein [Temperatibacter marinus]WND03436.1 indolepyruvate ferredoxin oxidoreductase family protein [Temperatibacter marinus]